MVVQAFNPLDRKAEENGYEFKASVVYRASSRIIRIVQKNSCLEKKKQKTEKNSLNTQQKVALVLLLIYHM